MMDTFSCLLRHGALCVLASCITSTLFLTPIAAIAQGDTVVVNDSLQGNTVGELAGGELTAEGFQPGIGSGHILYRLDKSVPSGYAEFEITGMNPAEVPTGTDTGFFAMYDGRGIEEPISYFDSFKNNFNRWNVHWRQNRGAFKAVVSCPQPTSERTSAAKAVFSEIRDWSVEPTGKSFDFVPGRWHKMRIEWGNKQFRVLVDGQEVWSASGPYEYAPVQQRIWLGSAPGYVQEGKAKYTSTSDRVMYRNFRLVSQPKSADSAPGLRSVASVNNDLKAESPLPQKPATTPDVKTTSASAVASSTVASKPTMTSATHSAAMQPAASTRPAVAEPLVSFAAPWTSPYRVDPVTRFHFINREGKYLFLLNKTAWAYFACRDPEGVLQRARAQGVNVLRVTLEGRPHFDHLKMDMWPWGGTRDNPDYTRMNDVYWNEVERRVRMAGEAGLGLDLVLYFTLKPGLENPNEAAQAQKLYWDTALERLGKYANILTWEIANEYIKNETFQDLAGNHFKANDPYGRPVCTSDGTTDDAVWPQKTWMDIAINHTCTSSTDQHDLEGWYLALARNTRSHGKPAFCNESGREKRHRNDDGVHRRKQGWLWCMAGAYWTYHSWEGCEGIDDAAYRGPGQEFLKPMVEYFSGLPFWNLNPNQTAIALPPNLVGTVLASPERDLVTAYLCTRETGQLVKGAQATLRLPAGEYSITVKRPADNAILEQREHKSSGIGDITALILPGFRDDVVVLVRLEQARERRALPGTG